MIVTDRGKKSIYQSKWDANQKTKERWLSDRLDALNYYNGRTREYVTPFFSDSTLSKVPVANINITKRIIDRISLCYQVAPIRNVTNDSYSDFVRDKDHKLQRFERLVNLLELVLIKPRWRDGKLEYDIITDFEPEFGGDDPMIPTAFTFPLQSRASVTNTDEQIWAYWSDTEYFMFNKSDNDKKINNNWNDENPYGIMPIIPLFKNGRPETNYLDTDASLDLCQGNLAINCATTTAQANLMFQSFGYVWVSGEVDNNVLEVSPDKITKLQVDSNMGVVTPPDSINSINEYIKTQYKLLAQNYHISTSFVDGGEQASSGVSLRLRNLELQESRKSSLEIYKKFEQELFQLERIMILAHTGTDIGELELVDFSESVEILSDQEQRERDEFDLAKGLIDEIDILTRRNPDWSREDAEEYLAERKKSNSTIKQKSDTPSNIFKIGE